MICPRRVEGSGPRNSRWIAPGGAGERDRTLSTRMAIGHAARSPTAVDRPINSIHSRTSDRSGRKYESART
jgi:hypothetical protein